MMTHSAIAPIEEPGNRIDKGWRLRSAQRGNTLGFCLAVLLALTLSILTIRVFSAVSFGALFTTTGVEEAPIYSIWKVVHAHPLYESPLSGYFGLGLYNWAFYELYGSVGKILGADGPGIIGAGRALTLVFAILGCIGFKLLLQSLAPRLDATWLWAFSILVWADSGVTGWWLLSVRPDIAALCAAVWGLHLHFRALARRSARMELIASCLFFAAWSFKQTTVLVFASCLLALLMSPRWLRGIAALLIPFASLALLTFAVGGHDYFLNTIYAPSINLFSPLQGTRELAQAISGSPFIWVAGALGAFVLWGGLRHSRPPMLSVEPCRTLLVGLFLASTFDILAICRTGSARNTLFEAFLVFAVIAGVLVGHMLSVDGAPLRPWISRVVVGIVLLNIFLLGIRLIPRAHVGRIELSSTGEYASRLKLANALQGLNSPVFIREGILSLPWHSNGNKYPAVMDDVLFYRAAVRHGDVKEYPIQTLVREHHFRTLLVNESDPALAWGLDAGCVRSRSESFQEWSLQVLSCAESTTSNPGTTQRQEKTSR